MLRLDFDWCLISDVDSMVVVECACSWRMAKEEVLDKSSRRFIRLKMNALF